MRICITGSQGQVASALKTWHGREGVTILPLARPEFDLAKAENALTLLTAMKPDVVISAAAYTAVDLAESNPDEAMSVNATGPGLVAKAAAALDVPILHLSTDYVFDGMRPTPYAEDCATSPNGVYGSTKLAGEQAVAAANPRHVILRTAWVYSHEGKNFVKTMLRLAETRPQLGVVSDQFGCPTYAPDIADALIAIARQSMSAKAGSAEFGVFHMAGGGDSSWSGFASAIFALARKHGLPAADVKPIATADYPTPARRPFNSRLDCQKLSATYGVRLPFWHDGLERCMAILAQAKPQ